MARRKLKSATDQRHYTLIYHDCLDSDKLADIYEKMLFITLKRYADANGQCFPSLKTLTKTTGMSRSTILRKLESLEQKGIIKSEKRMRSDGGDTSNIYTLYDYAEMWESEEEIEAVSSDDGQRDTIRMINTLRAQGYTVTKKKEPESITPTKAKDPDPIGKSISAADNKTSSERCQESVPERYTMEQIHQIYDYDTMVFDHPTMQQDIDTIMAVLYDALNTRKSTIRIDGEDKPAMIVIAKLMKLDKDSIVYAIRKYKDQTDRIRNVTAYILTMLYHAPEQYLLDVQNQFSSNQGK